MKIQKTGAGADGERAAARFLEKEGYTILKQNYKVSGAEVDVIAHKDETIVFIEVKTRGTNDYGMPEEFVDRRKRNKMIRAAKIFTADELYVQFYVRFDIISILYKTDDVEITHIQHAFEV